jgi:hypothetical protein
MGGIEGYGPASGAKMAVQSDDGRVTGNLPIAHQPTLFWIPVRPSNRASVINYRRSETLKPSVEPTPLPTIKSIALYG